LIITEAEVDEMLDILEEVLASASVGGERTS
jgi:hypothetical protein